MEWISVKDKLPKENEYVLVHTKNPNKNYKYTVVFLSEIIMKTFIINGKEQEIGI